MMSPVFRRNHNECTAHLKEKDRFGYMPPNTAINHRWGGISGRFFLPITCSLKNTFCIDSCYWNPLGTFTFISVPTEQEFLIILMITLESGDNSE